MSGVFEDIKEGKGWIAGVIGFTTIVAGVCTALFNWEIQKVTAVSLVAVCVVLGLSFVIQRAENRNSKRLEDHIKDANKKAEQTNQSLDSIKELLLESSKSTLRIEMTNEMARHPENHDTILRMAQKYFGELDANWIMWDAFYKWVEEEAQAGRKVFIPPELAATIRSKGDSKQRKLIWP